MGSMRLLNSRAMCVGVGCGYVREGGSMGSKHPLSSRAMCVVGMWGGDSMGSMRLLNSRAMCVGVWWVCGRRGQYGQYAPTEQ